MSVDERGCALAKRVRREGLIFPKRTSFRDAASVLRICVSAFDIVVQRDDATRASANERTIERT